MTAKEVDENIFLDEDYEDYKEEYEGEEKPIVPLKKKGSPEDEVEEDDESSFFEEKEESED